MTTAYALRYPDGTLEVYTVRPSADEAWGEAFGYVAHQLGQEWERRFWHRVDLTTDVLDTAATRRARVSASCRGYKIVKVEIREP